MQNTQTLIKSDLESYKIGDSDIRPWGKYIVTDVGTDQKGEEFCEKEITVSPGQILSLQSHKHRREHWKVIAGTLTVVLDGKRMNLTAGQSIDIPLHGIHCMANTKATACIVHERQTGLCSEDDITRYADAYGRAPEINNASIQNSIKIFNEILEEIKNR